MGQVKPHADVLLVAAAFSRHAEALAWVREQAEAAWGPIALASPAFDFDETTFYAPQMGTGLKKQFWAFERLVDAARLPRFKHQANAWEDASAALGRWTEPRPLNLDPGYLTEAKLVLASTKDHAHRVYVAEGIYAEVTLSYRDHAWRPHESTFPDYRRGDYHQFFTRCREYLRQRLGRRMPGA
jgi:hypothetical protein